MNHPNPTTPIDDLDLSSVYEAPTDIDWSHVRFDCFEPAELVCDHCDEPPHTQIVANRDEHDCRRCGTIYTASELGAHGPLCSTCYPVKLGYAIVLHEQVPPLMSLPVCLVRTEKRWMLALTGCASDWQIAAAYVQLGSLPPACLDLAGTPRPHCGAAIDYDRVADAFALSCSMAIARFGHQVASLMIRDAPHPKK